MDESERSSRMLPEERRARAARLVFPAVDPEHLYPSEVREAELARLRETVSKLGKDTDFDKAPTIGMGVFFTVLSFAWLLYKLFSEGSDTLLLNLSVFFFVAAWGWGTCIANLQQYNTAPLMLQRMRELNVASGIIDGSLTIKPPHRNWFERVLGHVPHPLPEFGTKRWLERFAAENSELLAQARQSLRPFAFGLWPLALLGLTASLLPLFFGMASLPDRQLLYPLQYLAAIAAGLCFGSLLPLGGFDLQLLIAGLRDDLGIRREDEETRISAQSSLAERIRSELKYPDTGDPISMYVIFLGSNILAAILLGIFLNASLSVPIAISTVGAFIWSILATAGLSDKCARDISQFNPLLYLAERENQSSLLGGLKELVRRPQRYIRELRHRPVRWLWSGGALCTTLLVFALKHFGEGAGFAGSALELTHVPPSIELLYVALASLAPWLGALLLEHNLRLHHQRRELISQINAGLAAEPEPPPAV